MVRKSILLITRSLFLGVFAAGLMFGSTLTGFSEFATDSSGTWNSGIATTGSCCQFVGVAGPDGTIVNTPGSLSFTLNTGDNWIYFFTNSFVPSYGGVNFYFDGNSTASISATLAAVSSIMNNTDSSTFSADSNDGLDVNFAVAPGSGALSYSNGGLTYTLSSLYWVAPAGYPSPNPDVVSEYGVGPDGAPDSVIGANITVSSDVTATPEPGTLWMLAAGCAFVGLKLPNL